MKETKAKQRHVEKDTMTTLVIGLSIEWRERIAVPSVVFGSRTSSMRGQQTQKEDDEMSFPDCDQIRGRKYPSHVHP